MSFTSRSVALGLCALLLVSSVAVADSREAPPTVLYRLGGESSFLSGCIVGLCLCPVRLTYMAGIFGLTPTGGALGSRTFSISDIDWFTHANGEVWNVITGSGTYYLDAETHRIVLDLQVDDAPPIHLDSGDVPLSHFPAVPLPGLPRVAGEFPTIDIGALTDTLCYQEGIGITAAPSTSSIEVSVVPPTMLTWTADPAAVAYDVVAGDLATLRATGGDFTVASGVCVANDVSGPAMDYAEPVEPGQGFWFLVRGLPQPGYDSAGEGQVDPRDWEIDASPNACP